ncbi:hypothetical protein GDO86_016856 [Hymenochirus boettgeri]|uniref:Tbk1/Ikki binding domain-containing protein n=1 Tax=Hymenochirus boettgeri TaxID=247094 RepID=A0A8T2IMU2_9PIPI|nr:hypothetical protein GDO86_016856 [Hymenochirus boettgeri]
MEKNIGEQLNKAYEAYRQACMDKEQAVKQMQQKLDTCEEQLHSKNMQITALKKCIKVLTSQLSAASPLGKGGIHGAPQSPKPGSTERWRDENTSHFTNDHLQEELKVCMQRERQYKEQLENEHIKFRKMEEAHKVCESMIMEKNTEIRCLQRMLKESNERQGKEDYRPSTAHDVGVKSKVQDLTEAASSPDSTRQGVEQIFSEIKEEFAHICKLTRRQTIQLGTLYSKKGNTNAPLQFSMPIQCTDEPSEEGQTILNQKGKNDEASDLAFESIIPQNLGADDEEIISLESLSKLSVKFPPMDDGSDFLKSAPEKLPFLGPVLTQTTHTNPLYPDTALLGKNFCPAPPNPIDTHCLPDISCNLEYRKQPNVGNGYSTSDLHSSNDSDLLQAMGSPVRKYPNTFFNKEIPDGNEFVETTERAVRGPQQAVWKPFQHPDNDLLVPGSANWDENNPDVCAFCRAVFPSTTTTPEDFLRHLNSHF